MKKLVIFLENKSELNRKINKENKLNYMKQVINLIKYYIIKTVAT